MRLQEHWTVCPWTFYCLKNITSLFNLHFVFSCYTWMVDDNPSNSCSPVEGITQVRVSGKWMDIHFWEVSVGWAEIWGGGGICERVLSKSPAGNEIADGESTGQERLWRRMYWLTRFSKDLGEQELLKAMELQPKHEKAYQDFSFCTLFPGWSAKCHLPCAIPLLKCLGSLLILYCIII